jgi:orotate phosphoribosyltransferase
MLADFKKSGGILSGHFLLTSGRHADTYMQCAKLFENTALSQRLCAALCKKFKGIKVDCVASPAIGGIVMGYETARRLKTRNIFFERIDGKMTLRRGFSISAGESFLVTEDVVTTGGSVKEVIEAIRGLGGVVAAVGSIVDRSNGNVDFGVPFFNLLSTNIKSYEADKCPLCADGALPLYKPGSRILKP